MSAKAISQFLSDVSALEACVERAGRALGCRYSGADEFEAENVQVWRSGRDLARQAARARIVLGATAITSFALILMLAL